MVFLYNQNSMKTNKFTLEAHKPVEGYIWMSDQSKPRVLKGEKLQETETYSSSDNPFIVEAQFVIDNEKSCSIKCVDGVFIVNEYRLCDYENLQKKHYAANKMEGVKGLDFVLNWKEEKDELCNGFPVLQPAELVFTGFTKD